MQSAPGCAVVDYRDIISTFAQTSNLNHD